jgi:branched-chain amino acid transport system ATP-binding protein
MTHSLQVTDLTVRYGNALALNGVTLSLKGGTATGIVGPNGAGKSSLLNALYGSVGSGRVVLDGEDITGWPAARRLKSGVALVPQGRQIFPRLNVLENLQVMAGCIGASRTEVDRALERFPILRERYRQVAGALSGGEQQMLAVSRALIGSPVVLLLDEMTTGLAPIIARQLTEMVGLVADEGAIVVIADPDISGIEEVIGGGHVLMHGEVVHSAQGSARLNIAYQVAMGMGSKGRVE